jgi:hypothetical protein
MLNKIDALCAERDRLKKRGRPWCPMARPWADGAGAERWIREVWRSEELSERLETEVFETFHDLLTREDHGRGWTSVSARRTFQERAERRSASAATSFQS